MDRKFIKITLIMIGILLVSLIYLHWIKGISILSFGVTSEVTPLTSIAVSPSTNSIIISINTPMPTQIPTDTPTPSFTATPTVTPVATYVLTPTTILSYPQARIRIGGVRTHFYPSETAGLTSYGPTEENRIVEIICFTETEDTHQKWYAVRNPDHSGGLRTPYWIIGSVQSGDILEPFQDNDISISDPRLQISYTDAINKSPSQCLQR